MALDQNRPPDILNGDGYSRLEYFLLEPTNNWTCIQGLDDIKTTLKETILLPLFFHGLNPVPLLLHGAPGVGKTLLATGLVHEAPPNRAVNLCYSHTSELRSTYFNLDRNMVQDMFSIAKEKQPSIVIIDDDQDLHGSPDDAWRPEFVSKLLQALDGLATSDKVGFIVVTNNPQSMPATLRKRFKVRLNVPPPDHGRRLGLLQQQMNDQPCALSSDNLFELAGRTLGYTCSDLIIICHQALMELVREVQKATNFLEVKVPDTDATRYKPCSSEDTGSLEMNFKDIDSDSIISRDITMVDMLNAISKCPPSVEEKDVKQYEQFEMDYVFETNYQGTLSRHGSVPNLQRLARSLIQAVIGRPAFFDYVYSLPLPKKLQMSLMQSD